VKTIQLDMYAVGLGASILVQCRRQDGQVVSILADGGMGHGGYPRAGVHNRLEDAFQSFEVDRPKRIDLMVGTHYDGDHLKGLVPIAQDDSIELGDVWLPPVKDDTDEIPGHVSQSEDYLAVKFYEDQDGEQLRRYLELKRQQVQELQSNEERIVGLLREQQVTMRDLPFYDLGAAERAREFGEGRPELIQDYLRYFEQHESAAAQITGTERAHGSSRYDSSIKDLRDLAHDAREGRTPDSLARLAKYAGYLKDEPQTLRLMPGVLATLRKFTASDAITSSHLHKLVRALRARKIPIRPRCHYITHGEPVRFAWNPAKRRFIPGAVQQTSEPVITLLGPPAWLVEKHRENLPVDSYLYALMLSRTRIRLERISASNQLSYIFTLESAGQRLLISGDAGCYGFKDRSGNYWPLLLEALQALHVVQVAHHAGHNYDFYNTLLAAGFAEQKQFSYLLLSHDVRDDTRPSDAFVRFIAQARQGEASPGLLFTSQPEASKVQDFDELICPVVPAGANADRGDVRLSHSGGTHGSAWTVEKHSVSV
jgi:hypothetical protein